MDDGSGDETVPAVRRPVPASGSPSPPGERLVLGRGQGPTLGSLTATEPLTAREVVRIGVDVATVLAELHERGHAHGSVTPDNIVVSSTGAQLVHAPGAAAVTQTGVGPARPADDVADLGAVLGQALAGPYGGGIPQTTPRSLQRVLAAATESNPEQRPTARQMADMLAWVARDDPAPPVEPGGSGRGVFIAAGVLIVLLAVLGYIALRKGPVDAAASGPGAIGTVASSTATSAPGEPSVGAQPPRAEPELPTALPELPTALSELPTALPDLPTSLPNLPEVPPEAQGIWDRFTAWVGQLWDSFSTWLSSMV